MISKRLSSFIVTVEEGTLSKAAAKLFTTAPPLSRQIKLLEDEVGFSLFTRSHTGMKLTRQGVVFYEQIIQAYNLLSSYALKGKTSNHLER